MPERRPLHATAVAVDAVLGPEPLDADQVLAGSPETSALVLATSPNGEESGIWRCTPGVFRDTEVDETFVVLEGRATIAFENDGSEIEIGPGSVCVLTEGARTVWTVRETIVKGFRLQAAPAGADR